MDFLIATISILVLVTSVVGSIFGNIVAAELYDWCPKVARRVIEYAIARLPEEVRNRYREEWQAHLDECPAKLSKLGHAIGCYMGVAAIATRINEENEQARIAVAELLGAPEAQEAFARIAAVIERSFDAAKGMSDDTSAEYLQKYFDEANNILAEYRQEHVLAVSEAFLKIFEREGQK